MLFCAITVANKVGDTSAALSADGNSTGSSHQVAVAELSDGKHAADSAAEKNETLLMVDALWQMASDKQPVCSASLLFQSPYYDRHVAFTTELFTAVATSSPLPYLAAMPPAVYRCDCHQRQSKSLNSHSISESSHTNAMPVPPDAVLVRPRMPLVAGKHAVHHETTSPPPSSVGPVLLLSSAVHDVSSVDSSSQQTAASTASVYGDGFYSPPASHTDQPPPASLCCCPHCGVGFAAVPRNIVYHPTGPSYVIHSFTPTLQPCYSVTASSIISRPPATYTTGLMQSSVHLADSIYQQSSTRPPLPPQPPSASLSFVSAGVRVRTARPPPSCANCGHTGHTQLDCNEPTIDTVLNTRE